MSKRRITVTVDDALVGAAAKAVADGEAESISAWVNTSMAARVDRDRRLAALATLVADYEREFGEITADELAGQAQADRDAAAAVRQRRRRRPSRP